MLVEKGVPEQVVQQVIQYAIQDLQQQSQGQNPQEEAQEQGQQQNPQEEQAEMGYGGMSMYDDGGMAMYGNGGMIKRADGSYSKRGLWDNIRANKGSGKAPTKEMLKQEKKIKAAQKAMGGMMYANGGKMPEEVLRSRLESHMSPQEADNYLKQYANGGSFDNPGFRALPMYVQEKIRSNMAYGGCMECGGKMETGGRFLRKAQDGLYDPAKAASILGNYASNLQKNPSYIKTEIIQKPVSSNPSYMVNQEVLDKLNSQKTQVNTKPVTLNNTRSVPTSLTTSPLNNVNLKSKRQPVNNSSYLPQIKRQQEEITPMNVMELKPLDIPSAGNLGLINATSFENYNDQGYNSDAPVYGPQTEENTTPFISPLNPRINNGLYGYDPNTGGNLNLSNAGNQQGSATTGNTTTGKSNWFNNYNSSLSNITGGNSYFGRGISHLGQATFDFTKGGLEMAGANISNRNALGDEARDLQNSMRAGYKKVGKRPTDGNAIISKYGGRMMQDGGATYADKMKVSKNSPEADFIAEKGEYIVNNGVASKLETGGSHASGNDTAISLDKSSNPSYVLSDTPRLKQLQFGGKRVSPSKYAEMATVEALGKTPDQILKGYTAFTKRANTEGKVFGDKISDATNQLLAQKYQKDLATVKQIADQAYHKQEQLKYAMGMDNDLDHAQQVNGIQMSQYGGMQDDVHMNYFNAPVVQYGGSPQLFSDPSELGYNTTQMAYGGQLPKAGNGWINTILNFESNTGSTQGTGLQNYGIQKAKWNSKYPKMWEDNKITQEEAIDFIEKEYLPKVKDYPEDVQKRLVDYAYNTGRNIEDVLLLASGKKDLNSIQTKSTDFNLFNKEKSNIIKNMSDPSFLNKIDDAKSVIMQDYWKRQGTPEVYNATSAPRIGMWNNQTSNTNNTNTNTAATAAAAPTSNYPTYGGGKYPSGRNTPGSIKTTNDFRGTADQYTKDWRDSGLDLSGFKTAKEVQEATYKELLKTPEGRDRIREMWKYGNTKLGLDKGIGKGFDFDKLDDNQLAALLPAYTDDMLGVRTLTPVKKQLTATTTTTTNTKKDDEVITGDEPVVPKLTIDKEEEEPDYDFPAINAFIPQPYGRNPIGLALAQPQTIRPAKLNIQPELNEYTRGMRGALRGTQGNTSVDVAQQMQGLNNLYGAQNRLFGQKYNFDEQSRMGAEQFNAQAIMNTDAANLQRIGVQQDLINRREGAIDTQRRKDFEKGIQNVQKENAYGLSKEYIESTLAPYLNNKGKLEFTYDPRTGEKINKGKEKSYTKSELDKMTVAERKAIGFNFKYGGPVKKIKLKLRK
jgi:hypothetical protein